VAEADDATREADSPPEEAMGRKFPLKTVLIVAGLFGVQVAVFILLLNLSRPAPVRAADQGVGSGDGSDAPSASLNIVDLGTFNVTQFQVGDPLNRRQLSITLAVAIDKAAAEADKPILLGQRTWIGQLMDEVIGPLPMDAIHSSNREPLKRQLKARINERLGKDVAKEVILRIQAFGP